jgi:hypothetical protein
LGPYPIALLLVAVLATDSLSETAERVRTFATAKSNAADGLCPLTGEPTFVEAVALVLDMAHQHWRQITYISLKRTRGVCLIKYRDNLSYTDSLFAAQAQVDEKLRSPTSLMVEAMLTRDLILDIARDLKKIAVLEGRTRSAVLQIPAASEQGIRPRRRRTVPARARRLNEGKRL